MSTGLYKYGELGFRDSSSRGHGFTNFAKSIEERDQANLALCKSNIIECINLAKQSMLGINAGHDLNLDNLPHLIECGSVDEVSIGHAIITDALKFGFEDTIMKYIKAVRNNY